MINRRITPYINYLHIIYYILFIVYTWLIVIKW